MKVDRSATESPISPDRLEELLRSLGLDEKAALTAGIDA